MQYLLELTSTVIRLPLWISSIWRETRVRDPLMRGVHIALVVAGTSLVTTVWPGELLGQGRPTKKSTDATPKGLTPKGVAPKGAKAKGGKTTKGGGVETPEEKPLEEIDFGVEHQTLLVDGAVKELDETTEGQKRLEVIVSRAKEIFEHREDLDSERRPFAVKRDRLTGEVLQLNQRIAQTKSGIQQAENNLRTLRNTANNGGNSQNVQNQIQTLQEQITDAYLFISNSQEEINDRVPEIQALNGQIGILDGKLLVLWVELNECRKQWLEVRQPQQKYAYGNYEGLQKVLNDWVLVDGLWPEAYYWDALCKYELGDYQAAWDQVERAGALRQTLLLPKAWAQGDALRGLIAAKLPDRRGKASNYLLAAGTSLARAKKASWFVLFLLGRAACENEKTEAKAQTYFERSLKSQPDSACVNYWLGHLRSTSTATTVRDADGAVKTLEDLWKKSTKQSWRLAFQMVLAYDGARRDVEAKATWDLVQTLAPKAEIERLMAERTENQSKLKLPASAETKSKTGSTKK